MRFFPQTSSNVLFTSRVAVVRACLFFDCRGEPDHAAGSGSAAGDRRQGLSSCRHSERPDARCGQRRRATRAGFSHQVDDRLSGVSRAQGPGAHTLANGNGVGEGLACGGIENVHRSQKSGVGGRAAARRDRAVGQRRGDCAGGSHGRLRGGIRRADESRGGKDGHEGNTLRERHRTARATAGFDRDRPRADRRGRHPGFPGVLPALFDQGVPLQQHHAIESQPAALERPVRRRRQDRIYRRCGLLSDRVGEAWPSAAACRGARRGVRCGARE